MPKQKADSKKRLKCTKTEYCHNILSRANESHSKGGLTILTYMHIPTLKARLRIAVHKLNSRDRGLVLNFCPWCGFDFSKRSDRRHLKDAPKKETRK